MDNELIDASDSGIYEDLFSSQVDKQMKIASILEAKFKLRKKKVQ